LTFQKTAKKKTKRLAISEKQKRVAFHEGEKAGRALAEPESAKKGTKSGHSGNRQEVTLG